MSDYLFDPAPDGPVHMTEAESLDFLDATTVEDLEGPAGDFVLALSLDTNSAVKKKARALLRRKGARPDLLETQKRFGRKASDWKTIKGLLEEREGEQRETLAYALHRTIVHPESLLDDFDRIPLTTCVN